MAEFPKGGCPMRCITLLLNDSEWRRITEGARLFWPNEVLDRQLSRTECARRLLLGALTALRREDVERYSATIAPSHPVLPGD